MGQLPLQEEACFFARNRHSFQVITVTHPVTIPSHDHDFLEMAFILDGSGYHVSGGQRSKVGANTMLVVGLGVCHGYEECEAMKVVNCLIDPSVFSHELQWMLEIPGVQQAFFPKRMAMRSVELNLPQGCIARCLSHLDLFTFSEHNSPSHFEWIGLLTMFLGELLDPLCDGSLIKSNHPVIDRVKSCLEENLQYEWTLGELADRFSLGRWYLNRMFSASLGVAPIAYLNQLRAEKAAVLLKETGWSIHAIGEKVGWPDPVQLARRFKAHFGCSAAEYRQKHRKLARTAA